jgi:arrestin-1
VFGIIVSYSVKVKLYLGALGGELTAELPFLIMHSKVSRATLFDL